MIGLLGYGVYVKHNQGAMIKSYERQVETDSGFRLMRI